VKEAHETLYHFHQPQNEAEANLWLHRYLATYNSQQHRSEPHSRLEDWLRNLPEGGLREMCAWERFCAFAREPERRQVGSAARISVEGVTYEVDADLAGEEVILWWGCLPAVHRQAAARHVPVRSNSATRTASLARRLPVAAGSRPSNRCCRSLPGWGTCRSTLVRPCADRRRSRRSPSGSSANAKSSHCSKRWTPSVRARQLTLAQPHRRGRERDREGRQDPCRAPFARTRGGVDVLLAAAPSTPKASPKAIDSHSTAKRKSG
jgi:hypothetical protein